jgi:segregation and condensation protein A
MIDPVVPAAARDPRRGRFAFRLGTSEPANVRESQVGELPVDAGSSQRFRIDLEMYRGPLDLLLYLVRKHEVDVTDIPISVITDQYLEYLALLEKLDVNAVGDFIEMASTLIEIKSRMVLPRCDEVEDELEDPREELVERLLQYKAFKDAASMLDERGREWQQRYERLSNDLPEREIDPADQPIHEVELWDLVSAMTRLMRDFDAVQPSNIVYDDTPIQVYMGRIHGNLVERGKLAFSEMFQTGMHKSAMIGIFLAILELVRHRHVSAEQDDIHGEIWIQPSEGFSEVFDVADIDPYEPDHAQQTSDPGGD